MIPNILPPERVRALLGPQILRGRAVEPKSRLAPEKIAEIHRMHKNKVSPRQIAYELKIGKGTVYRHLYPLQAP